MHGKLRCNQTGLILCVFLGLSTVHSEYPLKWSIIAKSEGADTFNSVELQPQKQKKTKKKETRKREQQQQEECRGRVSPNILNTKVYFILNYNLSVFCSTGLLLLFCCVRFRMLLFAFLCLFPLVFKFCSLKLLIKIVRLKVIHSYIKRVTLLL